MRIWRATIFHWWEVAAMSKIFYAELRRLLHFRLYYVECAAVILWSLLLSQPPVIDSFLFYIILVIGAFSAVCVSQFIGTEYSCGTIRNKLAVGHTRTVIYVAEFILQALAAVILFHLSLLTIVITGAICGWTYYFSFPVLFGYYLACICTIIVITAISVLVSMLARSNLSGLLILLALYLGLTLTGNNSYSFLKEREMNMADAAQTEASSDGAYTDDRAWVMNEYLLLINPYGQTLCESGPVYGSHGRYIETQILRHPFPRVFLFSAVESLGLTVLGIAAFKKKDIK